LNIKKDHDIGNPGPGLGQAPKCGGDIQVSGNGISTFLHHLIIGSPTTIQIYSNNQKHAQICFHSKRPCK
jgi:hypothetical protein